MECTRRIKDNLYWIGVNDRRLARFENQFLIPTGISYNAYLWLGEKTVLFDTTDVRTVKQFTENLQCLLDGRSLDYLIIHHIEPDHGAAISELMQHFPQMVLVTTKQGKQMVGQFFSEELKERCQVVGERDTLDMGEITLRFFMAPMVHWPEVMVSLVEQWGLLFSGDAFGTFGALPGNVFSDEVNFQEDFLKEARRYYSNIVGKYGAQVQSLLEKISDVDVKMICPLHGPVWRENLDYYINKHQKWSLYEPEDQGVVIFYGSMYGHTENAANSLALLLAERGVEKLAVYDISETDLSEMIGEMFRVSHWVLAAPTYNGGLYPKMEWLLHDARKLNLKNRKVALIENGSWAPAAGKEMKKILEVMENITLFEPEITIKSALKNEAGVMLENLADAIVTSLKEEKG